MRAKEIQAFGNMTWLAGFFYMIYVLATGETFSDYIDAALIVLFGYTIGRIGEVLEAIIDVNQ